MLVLEWIRGDLLALLVIVVIGITRLIPVEQLFDGFAGNAVISLIAVMITPMMMPITLITRVRFSDCAV